MLQLRYVPRLSVLIKADQVMIALDRGETKPQSSSALRTLIYASSMGLNWDIYGASLLYQLYSYSV